MITPRSALSLIAAAILAPAFAQTPALAQTPVVGLKAVQARLALIDQAYDRCMARAVTNPDYSACGGSRTQADDVLLNETWRGVYSGVNPEGRAALLDEQRAWIAYKDKSCLWNLEGQGREGVVIRFPACRATVIEDRILDLVAIADKP